MAKKRRSKAMELAAVDQWNSTFIVGAGVYYTEDDGTLTETRTRSEAWMLGEHTGVVQIEGKSGCVALERIRLRTEPTGEQIDTSAASTKAEGR